MDRVVTEDLIALICFVVISSLEVCFFMLSYYSLRKFDGNLTLFSQYSTPSLFKAVMTVFEEWISSLPRLAEMSFSK